MTKGYRHGDSNTRARNFATGILEAILIFSEHIPLSYADGGNLFFALWIVDVLLAPERFA